MTAIIQTQTSKTMTTREIADLLEKQHANIKISAERLAEKGVIGTLATQEFTHNGNLYTEYLLCKRDSLILVAQNCPEFTARVVDRWQALEEQAAKAAFDPASLTRIDILKMAVDSEEGRIKAVAELEQTQTKLAIAAPKAEALDRFATFAEGSMCLTNAAKALQLQPRKFIAWLQERQWIYRRAGGSHWIGYQSRIQVGYLEHKITTVERTDGSTKQTEQVLVTAKGLAKLATDLNAPVLLAASPADQVVQEQKT